MDENNKPNTEVEKLPDEDEQFGRVTNMLGANRVKVKCEDSEERICRIPGRMQKSEWIREQDLVIVEPWSFQREKGDVVHRYSESEEDEITRENTIQSSESEDN